MSNNVFVAEAVRASSTSNLIAEPVVSESQLTKRPYALVNAVACRFRIAAVVFAASIFKAF